MLELNIPIEPLAIQSVRSRMIKPKFAKAFVMHYQPKRNTDYKQNVKALIYNQLPDTFNLMTGKLEVEYGFIFSPLKSFSKKILAILESGKLLFKDTKPDMDNLQKGTTDAMTSLVFKDDSQIVKLSAFKAYGKQAMVTIKIKEIENE